MPDHFLVTGAMGCIGAWVVRNLVREGAPRLDYQSLPLRRHLRRGHRPRHA
jgi:nucleoside-diphosphate-sugar epimerase